MDIRIIRGRDGDYYLADLKGKILSGQLDTYEEAEDLMEQWELQKSMVDKESVLS